MNNRGQEIRFILNDQEITTSNIRSSDTLLDYLRLSRRLTGTKEGCAEGDCGACTVLVGRLGQDGLVYETVNACIRLLASVHGCHVVTVEHLSPPSGKLHPVQKALVDEHGSQCGFCTPGFVMSLYALWMANPSPSIGAIEQALQGNLCRCTGYEPIIKAALSASENAKSDNDPLLIEREQISHRLREIADGPSIVIKHDDDTIIIPANVDDLADYLVDNPGATLVAGATDVGLWVTKFMRPISPVIFVGHLSDLRTIENTDDKITIGAAVTYSDFFEIIHSEFPQLREFWSRIGGEQVRNMGTIGGNIANGSPIGDTPPVLIALGAQIVLRQGPDRRIIPIETFFIDYGKQDLGAGEFVEAIEIPKLHKDDQFAAYKISKRRDEDISSVCGAFRVRLDSNKIKEASIAFGGMAATPKRALAVEKALIDTDFTQATIDGAKAAFAEDFTPISDWRASSTYRSLVAANLLQRFFMEVKGNDVRLLREEVA